MTFSVGETVGGRYRVVRLLGEGGMAKVLEVEHLDLGTRHALKLLTVEVPGIHARLMLEGRIQATLQSPNIVPVTDVVRHDGAPGLVMQLIDGPALDQLLERKRLTLRQADALARGILAGVDAAHQQGCIHRDLKPANILLQVTDTQIVARVADFGLAKALVGDQRPKRLRTVAGGTMGTPTFMAPEQFKDARSADARADLFSLGAILYEMVTGAPAFREAPMLEVFEHTRDEDYVGPGELEPNLPPRMRRAIEACLRADPGDRPSSCRALVEMWEDGTELGDAPIWSPAELALVRQLSPLGASAPVTGERVDFDPTLDFAPDEVVPPEPPPKSAPTWTAPAEPLPAAVPPRRSPVVPALLIALPILAVLTVGGLTLTVFSAQLIVNRTTEQPQPVSAPVPTDGRDAPPAEEPSPAPTEPPAPTRSAAPAAKPTPMRTPTLTPAPTPMPVAEPESSVPPVAADEPAAVPAGDLGPTVRIEGVERAHLIDASGGRHQPGPVPPGRYEVWAFFESDRPTRVAEVMVHSDSSIALQCSPMMRKCM